jgi:hypothetical protein
MQSAQIRLLICVALIVLFGIIRSCREKRLIEASSFLQISWGVGGVVLITSVFIKALTNQQLLNLIGEDSALALLIGSGTQIIVSLDKELQADFRLIFSIVPFIPKNQSSASSSTKKP